MSHGIFVKSPDLDSSFVITLILNFLPLVNFLHSLTVCAANSLVGQRMTAFMPSFDPGYLKHILKLTPIGYHLLKEALIKLVSYN